MSVTIRRLREKAGMSQALLARRAKVTQGFISQLEAGIRKDISAKVAVRLAKVLDVPVGELLG